MIRNLVAFAFALCAMLALQACVLQGGAAADSAAQRERMQAKLDELIAAFEAGDAAPIENGTDHGMIGYQKFIEGVRTELNRIGQIRILLTDTQTSVDNGGGAISTRFEKRFVRTADSVPGAQTGRTMIVFRKQGQDWIITGIGGDNLFVSPASAP